MAGRGEENGKRPVAGAKPFAALTALRGQLRQAPRTAAPAAPAPATAAEDDGVDLARAMTGVAPLAPPNRAELARPKPEPVPRPRAPADLDSAASQRNPGPPDAFADAMAGVSPLAPSNRVDPDLLARQRSAVRVAAPLAASPETLSAWLDQAPAPHDPAALFRHAVGDAAPLADPGRAAVERPRPEPRPLQREADEREALRESIGAPLSFEDRLDMGDEAAFLRPGLPRRALTDLRRGRWVIQSELDLHGLTRDEARAALGQFLAERLTRGERCVRIIHGKGRGSPGRVGILKQLSRSWLAQREEILAFCQARPHDGGDGALLVLLRTPRPGE